jgi:hypothetical protein
MENEFFLLQLQISIQNAYLWDAIPIKQADRVNVTKLKYSSNTCEVGIAGIRQMHSTLELTSLNSMRADYGSP